VYGYSLVRLLPFDPIAEQTDHKLLREAAMNKDANAFEVPRTLGNEIGGNGRVYFENVVIDNLIDALLELSAAVWTHHDRVLVLEKILAAKGMDVSAEIEMHLPDDSEIADRTAERDAFVQSIFGSFIRRPTGDLPGRRTGPKGDD
jgi:hypothetical protein